MSPNLRRLLPRPYGQIDCCHDFKKQTTRLLLPRIDTLLKWGAVKEGDVILAKGREDKGTLLANGNVMVEGKEKSMQAWLKEVFGWFSVQTYVFAVHEKSGKTLS